MRMDKWHTLEAFREGLREMSTGKRGTYRQRIMNQGRKSYHAERALALRLYFLSKTVIQSMDKFRPCALTTPSRFLMLFHSCNRSVPTMSSTVERACMNAFPRDSPKASAMHLLAEHLDNPPKEHTHGPSANSEQRAGRCFEADAHGIAMGEQCHRFLNHSLR